MIGYSYNILNITLFLFMIPLFVYVTNANLLLWGLILVLDLIVINYYISNYRMDKINK